MRKLSSIAVLITIAFAVAAFPFRMEAAVARSHHAGRAKAGQGHASLAKTGLAKKGQAKAPAAKAKATSRASGKAATGKAAMGQAAGGARALRSSAAQGKVRATRAFKTETATGPATKGQVRAAMRGGRYARHRRSWPSRMQTVHLAMPSPLRGSHESLVHQNVMAEADGLERILDDADLDDRISRGSLVPVPVSGSLHINTDLPENRRYCRPWTAKFLTDLAKAHSEHFGGNPLEVTSAVRTVEYQRHLRTFNGNAAAADGDIASPHLTGGTIDLAKQGLTAKEIAWMRAFLIPLEQQGKIDVEEEFRQSCFHISVYKNYTEVSDQSAPAKTPVKAPLASASMLAAHGR